MMLCTTLPKQQKLCDYTAPTYACVPRQPLEILKQSLLQQVAAGEATFEPLYLNQECRMGGCLGQYLN